MDMINTQPVEKASRQLLFPMNRQRSQTRAGGQKGKAKDHSMLVGGIKGHAPGKPRGKENMRRGQYKEQCNKQYQARTYEREQ